MTMVTALQVLLFAASKVVTSAAGGKVVCLDDWINLRIDPRLASRILSIRHAIDAELAQCTTEPENILNRSPEIKLLIHLVLMLSGQSHNFEEENKNGDNLNGRFSDNEDTYDLEF